MRCIGGEVDVSGLQLSYLNINGFVINSASTLTKLDSVDFANGQASGVHLDVSNGATKTLSGCIFSDISSGKNVKVSNSTKLTFIGYTVGTNGDTVESGSSVVWANGNVLTVSVSSSSVRADNISIATITAILTSRANIPIPGGTINITVGGTSNTVSGTSGVTDTDGKVQITVKSSKSEVKTITASVEGDSTATITYQNSSINFNTLVNVGEEASLYSSDDNKTKVYIPGGVLDKSLNFHIDKVLSSEVTVAVIGSKDTVVVYDIWATDNSISSKVSQLSAK